MQCLQVHSLDRFPEEALEVFNPSPICNQLYLWMNPRPHCPNFAQHNSSCVISTLYRVSVSFALLCHFHSSASFSHSTKDDHITEQARIHPGCNDRDRERVRVKLLLWDPGLNAGPSVVGATTKANRNNVTTLCICVCINLWLYMCVWTTLRSWSAYWMMMAIQRSVSVSLVIAAQ